MITGRFTVAGRRGLEKTAFCGTHTRCRRRCNNAVRDRNVAAHSHVNMNRDMNSTRACILLAIWTAAAAPAAAQDARLVAAAANQDRAEALALIAGGADVNEARADGATALIWAAHWDDLELARRLLAAGADVNKAEDHGVTPLARAVENTSLAMVETLIAAGADVDAAQVSGLVPLMTAARTGNADVVRALLAHGAAVDAATIETRATALMWAVAQPHPGVVRILLDAGADPAVSTAKGFTPLMLAAQNGDIETARALIAAGADVDAPSADGTHVLPYAIVRAQDAFALFLLDEGADPNGAMGGVRALHAAAGDVDLWLRDWYMRHGRYRLYAPLGGELDGARRLTLVKALLDRGAAVNARITSSAMFSSYVGYPTKGAFESFSVGTGDLRGATPLWVAATDMNGSERVFNYGPAYTSSSTEVLCALLAAGADPHLTTDDGTTPLMAAAGLGRATYTPRVPRGTRSPMAEEAVRILLEAGADINAVNEADFTALHGAAFRGLNEVVEQLVRKGADIDARDFRGRTAYRMAEGSKQSFQFQSWPETAALLATLGADTKLGIPGTVQERLRDVPLTVATGEP